ncbi:ParB N-terminal domain-containing protein [Brucella oryzae]|uniref:ParB N-terminal domain-containing protein n=1 Tax=Brucella oryzae TaxID=335286 RepID=UPI001B81B93E|nr:ParB N-terminal domain-containing protein [Brucella oryzae]MBR7651425.1 ParB N-terminal domain-containing protein [Brucella oryzae]
MATYKTIPLKDIYIGDRARPVDEDHAVAIAASMADRGLINPITVRATPAKDGGKTPYTLVAGGHRYRAAELNQWDEIDVIVVSADAVEAQLMEISENLYRNELTALDRAIFVMKFREIHEEKFGKILRGGDQKSNRNDCGLIFTPGRQLSERVQERFGFGQRTYEYVTRIGKKLHPALRQAVRGTDAENDQKLLLKLAAMPETEQAGIAAALKFEPDLKKVLEMDKPVKPQPDADTIALDALKRAWEKASPDVRALFLDHIGMNAAFQEAAE